MDVARPRGPVRALASLCLLLTFLVACGDDDDGADEGAERATTTVDIVTGADDRAPATQDPDLDCVDPAPQEMGLGTAVGPPDGAAATTCWWVEVPADLDAVRFELEAGDADLELSVGFGFVTTVQFGRGELRSTEVAAGDTGAVEVVRPTPGPWFVTVGPGGSTYSLVVRTDPDRRRAPTGGELPGFDECAAPATELTPGDPLAGEVTAREGRPLARSYYCIETLGDFAVDLTGLSSDLDVLVRPAGGDVVASDRSEGGTTRTVRVDDVASGAYVIEVVAARPGTGSEFTIEAG